MLSDLPLELQYRILELALPPLVRLAVDERVQVCQTFALVHRDWTAFAQRELLNPVILRNKRSPTFPLDVSKRLRAARKGGRKVKRLLVDLNSGDVEARADQLAMPLVLPLELQLYILELALPPLILSGLDERVRLCKTFSLVHRTWTPFAQRELHEHITCTGKDAYERLAAAQEGGWPVKRIHVAAYGLRGDELYEQIIDKDAVEQVWCSFAVHGGEALFEGANLRSLTVAARFDDHRALPALFADARASHITYLAVRHACTEAILLPHLPQLRTLLLSEAGFRNDTQQLFSSLPSLERLGLYCSEDISDIAHFLPPTLRHLAYDEWPWSDGASDTEVEESADSQAEGEQARPMMARLAGFLVSCTVLASDDVLTPQSRVLRDEMTAQGSRFTELDEPSYEWGRWDLEEWAWSVSA